MIQITVIVANTITRPLTIPAIRGIGTWVLWLEDEAAPLSETAEGDDKKVVPDVDEVEMANDGGGGGSATVDDGGGDDGAMEVVVDTSSGSRTV